MLCQPLGIEKKSVRHKVSAPKEFIRKRRVGEVDGDFGAVRGVLEVSQESAGSADTGQSGTSSGVLSSERGGLDRR